MIINILITELTKFLQNDKLWFQQDDASSYTIRILMNTIE